MNSNSNPISKAVVLPTECAFSDCWEFLYRRGLTMISIRDSRKFLRVIQFEYINKLKLSEGH